MQSAQTVAARVGAAVAAIASAPANNSTTGAHEALADMAFTPGFTAALVDIACVAGSGGAEVAQCAAAAALKSHVARNWSAVGEVERTHLRARIVGGALQARAGSGVASQLAEVVAIVARQDYPKSWPALIPELAAWLASGGAVAWADRNRVLAVIVAALKHFNWCKRTPANREAMQAVLDVLAQPFAWMFDEATSELALRVAAADAASTDPRPTAVLVRTVVLLCKLFRTLISVQVCPLFAAHMGAFAARITRILDMRLPAALEAALEDLDGHSLTEALPAPGASDDTERATGVLPALITRVCKCIAGCGSRNKREFATHMVAASRAALNRLLATPRTARYDAVALALMMVATVSARSPEGRGVFDGMLPQLCADVLVPNVRLRRCDVDESEEDVMEYARRSVDGEWGLRRDAALDLAYVLRRRAEEQFTAALVPCLAAAYAGSASLAKNARDSVREAVVVLATAGAAVETGASRYPHRHVNPHFPVQAVYDACVAPVFEAAAAANNEQHLPMLTASAMFFVERLAPQLDRTRAVALVRHLAPLVCHPHALVRMHATECADTLLELMDTWEDVAPGLVEGAAMELMRGLAASIGSAEHELTEYAASAMETSVRLAGQSAVGCASECTHLVLSAVTRAGLAGAQSGAVTAHLFDALSSLVDAASEETAGEQGRTAVTCIARECLPLWMSIMATEPEGGLVMFACDLMTSVVAAADARNPAARAILTPLYAVMMTSPMAWDWARNRRALVGLVCVYMAQFPEHFATPAGGAWDLSGLAELHRNLTACNDMKHAFTLADAMLDHVPVAFELYGRAIVRSMTVRVTAIRSQTDGGGASEAATARFAVFVAGLVLRRDVAYARTLLDGAVGDLGGFAHIFDWSVIEHGPRVAGRNSRNVCFEALLQVLASPVALTGVLGAAAAGAAYAIASSPHQPAGTCPDDGGDSEYSDTDSECGSDDDNGADVDAPGAEELEGQNCSDYAQAYAEIMEQIDVEDMIGDDDDLAAARDERAPLERLAEAVGRLVLICTQEQRAAVAMMVPASCIGVNPQ